MKADASSATVKPQLLRCGACRHENAPQTQYCAECGHSLFEPCGECNRPVPLAQRFCGSCGFDLGRALQQRHSEQQNRLERAAELAVEHDYEQAIALLQRVASTSDYRFAKHAHAAKEQLAKVERLKEKMSARRADMAYRAKAARAQGDHRTAVACLQKVPRRLLDAECQRMLADSRDHLERHTALKAELREALRKSDWPTAGMLVDGLLEIEPEPDQYRQLAEQVAEKLFQSAQRHVARRRYAKALDCLDATPADYRNKRHRAARQKIETVEWLASQLPEEPFATATLGRLAKRYAQEVAGDARAAELVRELSGRVNQPPADGRNAFAAWRAPRDAWLGGDVGLLAAPQSIETSGDSKLGQWPGRFCVAIGLALQGLGLARIEQQFASRKSLTFSSLARWRKNSCWGIDVGSSSIHAVMLRQEKGDAKPVVVGSYAAEFDAPTCRPGNERNAAEVTRSAVEKMVAEIDFGGSLVYANLPARETINRFPHFPPVKEKQLDELLTHEIEHQLPVPPGELELVHWVAPVGEHPEQGRPSVISAAMKPAVAERMQLFTDTGVRVAGLQADPLALVNFIAYERAERLAETPAGEASSESSPAIAVLDAGASKTTLVIVSADACWFGSIESGSEDFTSLLARSAKAVAAEAEKLKRDPAQLPHPSTMFAPIEAKQTELRGRLVRIAENAHRLNRRFDVVETWCVGGAPLTHGWMRRVMLRDR